MWSWLRHVFGDKPSSPPRRDEAPAPDARSSFTPSDEIVLGVDLGTAHATAAVVVGDAVEMVPSPDGDGRMPSVVARTEAGDWLVGAAAVRQAVSNPRRTVFAVKRLLGRRLFDLPDPGWWLPTLAEGPQGFVRVEIDGEPFAPEQLAALLLHRLRTTAERRLGRPIRRAVLAAPVVFDEAQRQALLDAARIAGFEVAWDLADNRRVAMRLVHDADAVALADAFTRPLEGRVAVLDAGAGGCGCAVVDVGAGVVEVLASAGDGEAGGDDFDRVLTEETTNAFRRQMRVDPFQNPGNQLRLLQAVEQARRDLSQAEEATLDLPFLQGDGDGLLHLQTPLTRGRSEALTSRLLERCREVMRQTLSAAGRDAGGIGEVILSGGLTRTPALQALARDLFGRPARRSCHAEAAVAVGAALLGAQLLRGPESRLLLAAATARTVGVTVGATPLAQGLEIDDRAPTPMIRPHALLPAAHRRTFPAVQQGQTTFWIRVYDGEGTSALDCRLLAEASFPGAGSVDVTCALDANGFVEVLVRDPATGREQRLDIKTKGGLSLAEVERLAGAVETAARAEERHAALTAVREQAEAALRRAEDLLAGLGAADRAAVAPLLDEVSRQARGTDPAALHQALYDLDRALEALALFLRCEPGCANSPGAR